MTYSLVNCIVFGTFAAICFARDNKIPGVLFMLSSSLFGAAAAIQHYGV